MPSKKRNKKPPPTPANPENYILVHTKEGSYWRRKRGTVKEAKLNNSCNVNANAMVLASPAAKRIAASLDKFLTGLSTGRFIAHVSTKLRRAFKENGKMEYTFMEGYDFQPEHPMDELFKEMCRIDRKPDELILGIPIHGYTVKRLSKLVSGYYFEAILVWGDPSIDSGLKVESDLSPLYDFKGVEDSVCKLRVQLPLADDSWMLMFKISCLEGNSLAVNSRHYGMRVLMVG